jgi:hypothetical protein
MDEVSRIGHGECALQLNAMMHLEVMRKSTPNWSITLTRVRGKLCASGPAFSGTAERPCHCRATE